MHKAGKFQDSNPDLRLDVPIFPQSLPAVFVEGLSAVFMADLSAVCLEGLSAVFFIAVLLADWWV